MATLALAAMATTAQGITLERRANYVGGGSGDRGKCTVEVVVDGAADVEIRGDVARLRTLSGNVAEWRRFDCNARMPSRPADFRFRGIDGRGSQNLIRDPRQGGSTVVRIEDRQGGREGYTFDIEWAGRGGWGDGGYPSGGGYPGGGYYPSPGGGGYIGEQAIRACRDEVRNRARNDFGVRKIQFLDANVDNNPGRNDWVVGRFRAGRGDEFRFSCSVNLASGHVRDVRIDPPRGY